MNSPLLPPPAAPNLVPSVPVAQQAACKLQPQARRRLMLLVSFGAGAVLSLIGAVAGAVVAFSRFGHEDYRSGQLFEGLFELLAEMVVGVGVGYAGGAVIAILTATVASVMSGDRGLGGLAALGGAVITLPFLLLAVVAM